VCVYSILDCKPRSIPIDSGLKFFRTDEPKCNEQKKKQYHEILGIIGWKTAWTGPGLAFAHSFLSRFLVSPAVQYLHACSTLSEVHTIQGTYLPPRYISY
jgi:hypothetical protein